MRRTQDAAGEIVESDATVTKDSLDAAHITNPEVVHGTGKAQDSQVAAADHTVVKFVDEIGEVINKSGDAGTGKLEESGTSKAAVKSEDVKSEDATVASEEVKSEDAIVKSEDAGTGKLEESGTSKAAMKSEDVKSEDALVESEDATVKSEDAGIGESIVKSDDAGTSTTIVMSDDVGTSKATEAVGTSKAIEAVGTGEATKDDETSKATANSEIEEERDVGASTEIEIVATPPEDPIDAAENNKGNKTIEDLKRTMRLYSAALIGDWKTAKSIFDKESSNFTMKITVAGDTALHVAAGSKKISFVKKLVPLLSQDDLAITNEVGDTALISVARTGVVKLADIMLAKNSRLLTIHNRQNQIPILVAIAHEHRDLVLYLFRKTQLETLDTSRQTELFIASISIDYYDMALNILAKNPGLAVERMENEETALSVLAKKPPSTISSNRKLFCWKRLINSWYEKLYHKSKMRTLAHQLVENVWKVIIDKLTIHELSEFIEAPSRLIHDAARVGNVEFLIILIRSYPDLLWTIDNHRKSIFHVAVENRQENVFNLIYAIGGLKDVLANYYDQETNSNMLHLVGKLAAPCHLNRVKGPVLQMQREILWFKAVEKIVLSSHRRMRCSVTELSQIEIVEPQGLTPYELFVEEHKELLKEAEASIKGMAQSSMSVAVVVLAGVFAAVLMTPGGIDADTGTPNLFHKHGFKVFLVSDIGALVSSIASLFLFLSNFIIHYSERDFVRALPIKMLLGMLLLLISAVFMIVAFSAAFILTLHKVKAKVLLAVGMVFIVTIFYSSMLIYKSVRDIVYSAYWAKFCLRRRRRLF